jgi:hypothetical protein
MSRISEPKPCKSVECGQMIRFIENVSTGRKMPVNAEKTIVEPGNECAIVTEQGRFMKNARAGTVGYVPHWLTCPSAGKFKKPASPSEPV